jgi:hypothetical protein
MVDGAVTQIASLKAHLQMVKFNAEWFEKTKIGVKIAWK